MALVTRHPSVLGGTPCFAGTRVPVRSLFDWLAHGQTIDEFLENFPSVGREQVLGALELASVELGGSAEYAEPVPAPREPVKLP